ncbi:MAG: UDP-N-acetylmuramoyl-L-alanyl-D-glutamate--2,6-diaminopimelate ligase, partial [Ottowia sp.]|nr:UDP-N-acetylmuramoyl-L-alanyl-D-glutamate--2,6-diaminopimelate ligase [Ottowia sp.]
MAHCKVLHTPQEAADWLRARGVQQLVADSRRVGEGDGFLAWPGAGADARNFVQQALGNGAAACLMELDGAPDVDKPAVACMEHLHAAAGEIASAFYGEPSKALNVVAFTGTNGKTSSAWWLASVLSRQELGALAPCGLIGTLGMGLPGDLRSTGLTTPEALDLQRQFRQWADAGVRSCSMEASSIGLEEGRLDGCAIRVAVFSNFTQDHLDWHGDMERYWQAKLRLFDWPGLQAAVINLDDARGAELAAHCRAR